MNRIATLLSATLILIPLSGYSADPVEVTPNLKVTMGAVNLAELKINGKIVAVYGNTGDSDVTLLTHHRRDVLFAVDRTKTQQIVAPEAEKTLIETPEQFWQQFQKTRFHDYGQQSTKILASGLKVDNWVKDKDLVSVSGSNIRVVSTPGYTRGSVSYLVELDEKRIAFTGDLIFHGGRLFDIYSFQDAIKEANVRGYHGFGGRFAALVNSLDRIKALNPDIIVPVRGPIIRNPTVDLTKLKQRVQALYHNYLSTNALHWYFKKDRMTLKGKRVLGENAKINLMPYSHHEKAPDWVFEKSTSRLLISDEGNGFLLDCGGQGVIDSIKQLIKSKVISKVEGIFVTHYHDDHTDKVQAAAEEFNCPVYALEEYADVLSNPDAYHLPAMTSNPIKNIKVMKDGDELAWHEFKFTFHFFPGQSYYHGGLFVRKGKERPIFFVGDSFAPSGMDDYCTLNRNLVHPKKGYGLCLKKLADAYRKEPVWIVNEHIPYVFEFSPKELDYLQKGFQQRVQLLRELSPWDNPNFMIDEQWAFFKPYAQEVKAGSTFKVNVRVENHSHVSRKFTVTIHSDQVQPLDASAATTLQPAQSALLAVQARAPTKPGLYLLRADVRSNGIDLRDWIESMIIVN